MIENDPGNIPSSSGLPLGQSSSMSESEFNILLEAIESETISKNDIMQVNLEDDEIDSKSDGNSNQVDNDQNNPDNQDERDENSLLRAENDKLRAEAINNGCLNCGDRRFGLGKTSYNEQQLRLENARLKEEVDRISKPYIIKVAMAAMEELLEMAQMGEPLWFPSIDGATNFLNEEEYERRFSRGSGPMRQGIKIEASRETIVVIVNHINLVEILMDTNQWASFFSSIVSTALTVNMLSNGLAENLNGAMKMIYAEFQVPSPQIPTRDCYFVRYCKRTANGTWAIVDVSLDHTPTTRCRKRPSGCLIKEMPNGYSKVTWIEHIEVDDTLIKNIYMPLINSGLAFGAKRWIATLDRQCERLASAMATDLPQNDICHTLSTNKEGRKSMLKLGERMVISYCSGVSATTTHQWTTLMESGYDINDVRVMIRQSIDDPGRPYGTVVSASTSFWLPIPPKIVFDFLRDNNKRGKWDILSDGGDIQEVAQIANGREIGNRFSILRVNSLHSVQSNMLILQQSSTDPTGSFIIYAPIDVHATNVVLCGGHPDYVPLLPSGFAILPDGTSDFIDGGVVGSGGSLLTVAFQILIDNVPTANLSPQSVATINNLMSCTINKIKVALLFDD
ncbi:hypothetical protein HAX54_040185 [Datura stramonium]|uniref:START domain-containing protein n=1 Tax=Datura stramonium TaxID=4076 RepID=A0ABS8VMB7_DATST|nr:hypothetical protein [Datura stramonium]